MVVFFLEQRWEEAAQRGGVVERIWAFLGGEIPCGYELNCGRGHETQRFVVYKKEEG